MLVPGCSEGPEHIVHAITEGEEDTAATIITQVPTQKL